MNVLVIAHYQNDGYPSPIFVHKQVKAFVENGMRVLVVVPVPIGKTDFYGRRLSGRCVHDTIDGVDYCFVRFLSISTYGEDAFNTRSLSSVITRKLTDILGDFTPDIIHAHTFSLDSGAGTVLKSTLGCPLVVTTHGSDTERYIASGRTRLLKDYCDSVDAVVAVSSALRKKVAECGTRAKLFSVLNGYENKSLDEASKNGIEVVQVSNLIKLKHADDTIKAFEIVHSQYASARLTLIGDGPELDNLEHLVDELGLTGSVSFLGRLPNDDVMKILSSSSYFMMLSYPEGLGIAYLEAMANGCVTIGTEGEGIADVIEDGRNGYLVPKGQYKIAAERILECISDENKRRIISINAANSVNTLTWKNNAAEYERIFNELMNSPDKI